MTTNFVPQEISKQLRELGFNEPCIAYYDKDGDLLGDIGINEDIDNLYRNSYFVIYKDFSESEYTAPLYQQAFRWFREKYGLSGWVNESFTGSSRQGVISIKSEIGLKYYPTTTKFFDIYEEAELACLNKLIEIVKTK